MDVKQADLKKRKKHKPKRRQLPKLLRKPRHSKLLRKQLKLLRKQLKRLRELREQQSQFGSRPQ